MGDNILNKLLLEIDILDGGQDKIKKKIGNKLEQAAGFIQDNGDNNIQTANAISGLVQAYSLFLISERIKELGKIIAYYGELNDSAES